MKVKEKSEKVGIKLSIQETKIMASSHITSWQINGETMEIVRDYFGGGGSKITADGDCSHEIKRCLLLGRKAVTNLDSILKSRDITLLTSQVWMWELDHKEGWAPKNWCFWTVVLEKTFEGPLDCKEIQPVSPKGNCFGRTDAEVEAPVPWPLDVKSWLIGKDLDTGKDWRQEKGTTEDERVGWHHSTWWTWVCANSGR